MQQVFAKCSERCGWVGQIATGWVKVDEGWARRAQVPQNRLRERGGAIYFRRRLRDTPCPSCGVIGVDRAVRITQRTADSIREQIRNLPPPRAPRWPL